MNGRRIDIGAYGGTAEASMLPVQGPVLEGGRDAVTAAGVTKVEIRDGMSIIEVGSGQYVFETAR